MKKQFLALSFLAIFGQFQTAQADVDALSFRDASNEKSQWETMEWVFITDLNNGKNLTWKHIAPVLPAAVTAFSAYQYANLVDDKIEIKDEKRTIIDMNDTDDFIKNMRRTKNVYSILGLGSTGVLAYQYLQCYLAHQANRQALQSFFANWDENQDFTPEELYFAFEVIAERIEFEGMESVLADADLYIDLIQNIIMRHFESRYKSVLEAKGRDALADSKTIIETFKNIFDGAKHVQGTGK